MAKENYTDSVLAYSQKCEDVFRYLMNAHKELIKLSDAFKKDNNLRRQVENKHNALLYTVNTLRKPIKYLPQKDN